MPTNYSGRIIFILAVLLGAFWCIDHEPWNLFDRSIPLGDKIALRPGIDMVGGVSLIYEIKPPAGGIPGGATDLAEKVMEALKKRVDPDGLRNLIWRPQGNTRLEIQMPLSSHAGEARQKKEDYDQALRAIDATNLHQSDVVNAVENLTGAARDLRLAELAMGDPERVVLFKQLATDFDKIQQLKSQAPQHPSEDETALLAARLAPLVTQYDAEKSNIESSNLTGDVLEANVQLARSDPAKGQPPLAKLESDAANFPKRAAAIKNFEAKYADYDAVKSAVSDATDLKRLLHGSGVLEYHILADARRGGTEAQMITTMRARMGDKGPGPAPLNEDADQLLRWYPVEKVEEFDKPGYPPQTTEWKDKKNYVLCLVSPDASMTHRDGTAAWGLVSAYPVQGENGDRQVGFKFDHTGATLFGTLTREWYQKSHDTYHDQVSSCLAILLDDKVISAPRLNGAIEGGSGVIEGGGTGFSTEELTYLIQTLNAGSLPAQLSDEPISEQTIGPQLGADNLHKGLVACAFGLVVVGIFLVSYYYVAGIVAFCAVLMNLVLILGIMAAFGATFTLPSIAGIVLTVGTAVDANVLIFERLREEQHRGLSLRMALRNSYGRAASAIVDSNMTTAITSAFLYFFGSEEVKGFGLTLLIGIGASLFTALFVTKTIFGILIDHFGVTNLGSLPLTYPKWDKMLKPSWDWMGKAWIFYSFSIVMIVIGVTLFVIKTSQGKMLDIEFTKGTSIQFALKDKMSIEAVRKRIEDTAASAKYRDALPSPSVVAVGTKELSYEVDTPNQDRVAVRDAIMSAMQGVMEVEPASKFDLVEITSDSKDFSKVALPIGANLPSIGGYVPPDAATHRGGAALVLNNLSPPLSANQIKQRMDNERLSAAMSGKLSSSAEYIVDSPVGPDAPTDKAIVIASDPNITAERDPAKWKQSLASPVWNLAVGAVNRPPMFQKENNFDAQVAGEMRNDAILALTLSIAVIMAYIWIRFGNLKYGTATVIALIHDTVFTIAAIGFAHYLYDVPWVRDLLQLEPFRINLTVVAGILTIMGYSMIDTIVVFDRIRENRGKYGHLNRQVINDAINQTLSRTLLTAGTTVMTVAFMYFLGGAGIHGFTFVLLVGILVGTYSSVAIAAPLLLIGAEKESAEINKSGANPMASGALAK